METSIQIKNIHGSVIFEFSKENNSLKETLEEALRRKVKLTKANLAGEDLSGISFAYADLTDANFFHANLSGTSFFKANLVGADFAGAKLTKADLSYANLVGADLTGAKLTDARLFQANLTVADLWVVDFSRANLRRANLTEAGLTRADLTEADLTGANLTGVKYNERTAFFLPQCPDGAFIGYKNAGNKIVKLMIPEDAKRLSATSLKCRCSKAKVLEIQELDGSISNVKAVSSNRQANFIYRVGEEIEVENFDEDRWKECSTGIHFFISREMAVAYR